MAIEYVEIRNESKNMSIVGIIDMAVSIIWHSVYFGVGDFEIYAHATKEHIELLRVDNYVTRPDNQEVGIIERIEIVDDAQNGKMITATGRFAKSILDRRVIYKLSGSYLPTLLIGNIESSIRGMVSMNAINCPYDQRRNIPVLALGEQVGFGQEFTDKNGTEIMKQVPCENLLTYTDEVLKEYGLASTVKFDEESRKLLYSIYVGENRGVGGRSAPIIFSEDFDNLISSNYQYNATTEKNMAIIGGEGEGNARRYVTLTHGANYGLKRREIFVDASSVSQSYKNENDEDQYYTNDEYAMMLVAAAAPQMAVAEESFVGTLDLQNSQWVYNRDFALGDIVTIQNNMLDKYVLVQILEVLEVQDANGYTIEATTQTYTEDNQNE